MSLDIDQILDRRQLRRRLSFWRIGSLILLALLILMALNSAGAFKSVSARNDHIARVAISGMIVDDRPLLKMLKSIKDDNRVKGVMLVINSPGGTTVGGEAIFEAVRQIAEKKPVVTSIGTLAASAGYMIATASDHIVARRSSIVGSIGVIFQYPQAGELLDKIGVTVKEIKSSPLKAEPSPFHAPPPEAEAAIEELIGDSYQWFVDLVTDRRPLNRAEVLELADGRVFSGDRSVQNKLIDAIGGEEKARKWLVEERKLDNQLKVLEWQPKRPGQGLSLFSTMLHWMLPGSEKIEEFSQLNGIPATIRKRLFAEGLLSIWVK